MQGRFFSCGLFGLAVLMAMINVSFGFSQKMSVSQADGKFQEVACKPVLSSPEDGSYVIVLENGKTTCRTATPEEATILARHQPNQTLHILPRIFPNQTGGLKIVLRATQALEANPQAKVAFQKAAARWETMIKTPVTIVIDADFGPTFFGQPYSSSNTLGATSQFVFQSDYTRVRSALVAGAATAKEAALVNALPASSVPTDLGPISTVFSTSANLRALRILDPVDTGSDQTTVPRIGFNSNFSFDLDPSDGIDRDKIDFDATATHEIGHALGFTSRVGEKERNPSTQLAVSVWDIFRFRPGITLTTFSTANRILSPGDPQIYFSMFEKELGLSTGRADFVGGDRNQASHWKANELSGVYIGIMDPTGGFGERNEITDNDLTALDSFGYTLMNSASDDTVPPTVTNVSPKGGETFTAGDQTLISWTSTDDKGISSHSLTLSRDGGQFYPITIATGVAGSAQSFSWTVNFGIETTQARIRVTATDRGFNNGIGESTGNFTIKGNPNGTPVVLKPAGLGTQPKIFDDIDSGVFFSSSVKNVVFGEQLTPPSYPATLTSVLYLSINSAFGADFPDATGANFKLWVFSAPTGASFSQTSPLNIKKYDVTIQKEPTGDMALEFDDFNEFKLPEPYTITSGSFFVALQFVDNGTSRLNPDGSRNFVIPFDQDAPSTAIFSNNGGATFGGVGIILNLQSGPKSADFPLLGRALVTGSSGDTIAPTVKILSPNGGEKLKAGSTFTITWQSSDDKGVVSHEIFLSTDGGQTFPNKIATGLAGSAQSFTFSVPSNQPKSKAGRIRVTARDASGNQGSDDSDANFKIKPKK